MFNDGNEVSTTDNEPCTISKNSNIITRKEHPL